MSAFEDFVQLELPKRPYLNTDVDQETVIVRRGVGPRQLDAIALADGEVLGKVGGVLQGVSVGEGATFKKYIETFVASTEWEVTHSLSTVDVVVQVFDGVGFVIIPSEIQITSPSVVTVTFNTAQAGTVRIIGLS